MTAAVLAQIAPSRDVRATIERAVLSLAGVCDGANSRDDCGYNGTDAGWGKRTARAIQVGEVIDLVHAQKVVSKYHRQLTAFGIDLPNADDVAAEYVGDRIPARVWPQGWTQTQHDEFTAWIQRAGRRLFQPLPVRVEVGRWDAAVERERTARAQLRAISDNYDRITKTLKIGGAK